MYLKATNAVLNLKTIKESHVRPQFSYFMYNPEPLWEKYKEHASQFLLRKKSILTHDEAYIYYLQSGVLRFSKEEENDVLPLFYLGKGSLCYEMHVIGHIATKGNFYALEDCRLLHFPVSLIRQIIHDDIQLSFSLMESIGAKYSIVLTRLSEIGTSNLLRNTARLLLDMLSFYSFQAIIVPPICQRELSNFFCVHRSSIHRAISTLREEKIIGSYTKNKLEILNLSKLIKLASVTYL